MNKPPAFQFYADDFLGGTMTMDHAERGFYILLLSLQWTQGGISPTDFERLGRAMAQPSLEHVKSKFKLDADGLLKNSRMELERAKQAQFRANRSESGKRGSEKRWHSHSTAITQPMANGMAKHSSPSPSPSPISTNKQRGAVPTLKEVLDNAQFVGMTPTDAEQFWHHFEASGWIDKNGNLVQNWRSKQATWKTIARSAPAEAEHHGRASGASAITLGKEYERVIARIKQLKDGCATDAMGSKFWAKKDKAEYEKLVLRREELRKLLGVTL
jgi:uncharacterized protein YdaU (DUF1376 family)